jgi:hypothetical protein
MKLCILGIRETLLISLSPIIHVHGVNGWAANGRGRSLPATIRWWPFEKLSW